MVARNLHSTKSTPAMYKSRDFDIALPTRKTSFNSTTTTMQTRNGNELGCEKSSVASSDVDTAFSSLEEQRKLRPTKGKRRDRSTTASKLSVSSRTIVNSGHRDPNSDEYKKSLRKARRQRKDHNSEVFDGIEDNQQGYQLDNDYEEALNDVPQERRSKAIGTRDHLVRGTILDIRTPLKVKERRKKRKDKKDKKKEKMAYYELQLKQRAMATPISAMSMDDDWFEELHGELHGDNNQGSDVSDTTAFLRSRGEEKSLDNCLLLTPTSDQDNEEGLLSALEAAHIATCDSPFKTPQSKCDSAARCQAQEKLSRADVVRIPHFESTPPDVDARFQAFTNERQDTPDYGPSDSTDSPDSPSPQCVTAIVSSNFEQLKKPNPSTIKSFIASSEWQGHKKILDDWRDFVVDKRSGTKKKKSRRRGFTHQASERNFSTKAKRETKREQLTFQRRTSTGMIGTQQLSIEDDGYKLDQGEAAQRKRVLWDAVSQWQNAAANGGRAAYR